MRIVARSAVFPSALVLFATMTLAMPLATSACGSDGSGAAAGDEGGNGNGNEGGAGGEGGPGADGSTTGPGPDGASPDGTVTAPACSGKTGAAGDRTVMLTVDGKARTFDLHVPATYDATKGTPLVFLFHGYTMTPAQIAAATHFAATADARGLIVAFPAGIGQSFNAGDCCGQAVSDPDDDVAFTRAMITSIGGEYCVDAKRTYASGFSNGGFFSYYLACQLADQIAAVAAVSGGLRIDPSACKPKRPMALLHVHGTNDVVVPFTGGGLGNAQPVSASIDAFRTLNACAAGAGTVVYTKDDVSCTTWGGCTAGTDVELCTVTGGGHQWPGGDLLPYGANLSANLDTSKAIADFFAAHPMP
jgi:polyhydroxybutyrate depolymerase